MPAPTNRAQKPAQRRMNNAMPNPAYNPRRAQVNSYAGARQQRPAQGGSAKKSKKQPIPVKKNRRRERDYFFIMRRGVCALMMILSLLWIAVIALNYLAILPEYTSFLIEPDLTPMDERLPVEVLDEEGNPVVDEEGNPVVNEYEDKSTYISFIDPIFGALNKVFGVAMTDENGASKSPFYDGVIEDLVPAETTDAENKGEETPEGEASKIIAEAAGEEDAEEGEVNDGEEGESISKPIEMTDELKAQARAEDTRYSLATMVFEYFPILLAVGAVFALVIFLISLFSLFGRRIYRGFFWLSLIMVIAGVAAFFAGMVAMGNNLGAPYYLEDGVTLVSIIDFTQVTYFLTGAFTGAPETALDPTVSVMPLEMVAGYGLLIVVALPIIMLILSLFTKRKVPYSIFDK